ncbi:hypothetical protein H2200_006720 [Cladophialophora chaetospira]|uniref:Nephrocystin 3-like N-terminal domain-containing protein n=1 Tax=Cladophialophora chaetospira TaxID=386627 RepID=A0AA38X9B7_9EURO|nr:hypothetical protein H2200_006720 [Cladophialophora chaetospira]
MSGVEVFSLATGVMQTIEFAWKTLMLCKAVYRSGLVQPELLENALSLKLVSTEIQQKYGTVVPTNQDEKHLISISKKCERAAVDLEEEVKFLNLGAQKGDLISTLSIAAKASWRKGRLIRLEKNPDDSQQAAALIQQQQGFEKFDKDLQYFVLEAKAGHTKLSDLVSREAVTTRLQASRESRKLLAEVERSVRDATQAAKAHVATEVAASTKKITKALEVIRVHDDQTVRHNRVLQSLKYTGMNERANMILHAHEKTFEWIFEAERHSEDFNHPWDSFSEWLRSSSKLYWISGKPGAGKSTLMKYLLGSPQTKAALDIWMPGTIILSHFFWKPGFSLQKTLKGLLCSILHQAFRQHQHALGQALTIDPSLDEKDSHTDWSITDLFNVCNTTLKSYDAPVCMFIDGLDEIAHDDAHITLMQVLSEWHSISAVKLCVASRPELAITKRLQGYPSLRLQDLTAIDMTRFAEDAVTALLPRWDSLSDLDRFTLRSLATMLVDKAEGVFLWLRLATASLQRGADNGDTIDDLHRRLNRLPNDLFALYKDIWSRLNEDEPLYHRAAAEYVNLVLTANSIYSRRLSLLEVMSALGKADQRHYLFAGGNPSYSDCQTQCERFGREMLARTAGLLELTTKSRPLLWSKDAFWDAIRGGYGPFLQIDFIHRSAYEFLTSTEEGRHIRSADQSTHLARSLRLIKANIYIAFNPLKGVRLSSDFEVLARVMKEGEHEETDDSALRDEIHGIFDMCSAYFEPIQAHSNDARHFLAVVARYPSLSVFVASYIQKTSNPSLLATKVLQDLDWSLHRTSGFDNDDQVSLVQRLLALGADPNAEGLLFRLNYRPAALANFGYIQRSSSSEQDYDDRFFGHRKQQLFYPHGPPLLNILSAREDATPTMAEIIKHFLDAGLNPNLRTCVLFSIHNKGKMVGLSSQSKMGVLDLGDPGDFMSPVDAALYLHGVHLVLHANLEYLVNGILARFRRLDKTSKHTVVHEPGERKNENTEKRSAPFAEVRYVVAIDMVSNPSTSSKGRRRRRFRIKKGTAARELADLLDFYWYGEDLTEGRTPAAEGLLDRIAEVIQSGDSEEIPAVITRSLAEEKHGWIEKRGDEVVETEEKQTWHLVKGEPFADDALPQRPSMKLGRHVEAPPVYRYYEFITF